MDPDLGVDPDPRWIRIQAIPIPDLLDAIPDPDPDPAKNGIVTPLEGMHSRDFSGSLMVRVNVIEWIQEEDPALIISRHAGQKS